ncbi:MAG: hypothetical protein LW875_03050 [Proteobacteria bacterium]|jgi:hypothetical protein|nr:hypothetical protein [Pseudomonadota bacterium]
MKISFSLSKKGKRQFTSFQATELIYDDLINVLDDDRKKSLALYKLDHPEIQTEIEKIKSGLSYADQLSKVTLSQELIKEIMEPETTTDAALKQIRFQDWPVGLRMALETLLISIIIASLSIFIPWHKVTAIRWSGDQSVVLAEIDRQFEIADNSREAGDSESDNETKPAFQDENIKHQKPEEPKPTQVLAVQPTVPQASPSTTLAQLVKSSTSTLPKGATTGFLYRGSIQTVNASAATLKITEKLRAAGGRKAGEVEMGWRREQGIYYYHFTIPESKYEEVRAAFSEFGNLKLNREKHERIMPEGIIRLIISVEDKSRGGS